MNHFKQLLRKLLSQPGARTLGLYLGVGGALVSAISWMIKPGPGNIELTWWARILGGICLAIPITTSIWLSRIPDLAPEYLPTTGQSYFEADGFCFLPTLSVRDGRCHFVVLFENRFEQCTEVTIMLNPTRVAFRETSDLVPIRFHFTCPAGGSGNASRIVSIPLRLAGKQLYYDVTATSLYQHGKGRELPLKDWHRILGELRSMSLALPGARGLFSLLQEAFRHHTQGRLPLSPALHDVLDDMREFYTMLRARPTRLYELVPLTPTLWGTHDAAGHGAGGVWFPSTYATPRAIKLHSASSHSPCCALHEQQPPCCALHEQQPSCCALHEQQPHRCALLGQQPPSCAPSRQQPSDCAPLGQQFPGCAPLGQQPFCSPIVWRVTWPKTISAALVSRDNPTGTITNSDLELAGAFLHHACAAACFDIRERTVKSSTDNTPTLYWERKGSTTTTGPAAYLLRLQALHQRFHRYIKQHDYIPGPDNKMADDASRLHHLTRQQFLTHFQSTYPQNRSWRIWTPPKELVLSVILALRKQRSPVEWFLAATRLPKHTGKNGQNSALHMQSTLSYPASTIPLSCSKSLLTDTVPGCMLPVESLSRLAQWKVPYARLAKRLPVWGPTTHGWHPMDAHSSGSNASLPATPDRIPSQCE